MPTFCHVPVADIAVDDQPFLVTYRPQMQRLADSVARVGVLVPLHLWRPQTTAPLQLVTGSKRLCAARQAGLATVPALVHEAGELTKEQGFLLAVHDNLGCRSFNAVEKARVLRRLRVDFQYRDEPLMKEFCPLLDLPPRAATLEAYCSLATLDEALQAATVEHALPVDVALWVGALDTADRQAVLPL
ncbi:MAG: ParB N-terminal domain-containing protein, partial [Candidatus Tectomicrobia bacterium]|nr:ParB N-terminal domain-containing protein [Candidatus Tectomicrobia bacterium]